MISNSATFPLYQWDHHRDLICDLHLLRDLHHLLQHSAALNLCIRPINVEIPATPTETSDKLYCIPSPFHPPNHSFHLFYGALLLQKPNPFPAADSRCIPPASLLQHVFVVSGFVSCSSLLIQQRRNCRCGTGERVSCWKHFSPSSLHLDAPGIQIDHHFSVGNCLKWSFLEHTPQMPNPDMFQLKDGKHAVIRFSPLGKNVPVCVRIEHSELDNHVCGQTLTFKILLCCFLGRGQIFLIILCTNMFFDHIWQVCIICFIDMSFKDQPKHG